MKKLLPLALAVALCYQSNAQTYVPIALTGFNADVIADGTGPAASSTSVDVDGTDYNFVAQNYKGPTNQTPAAYLPSNGLINSAATSGLSFQLASYTGNNSLRLIAGTGKNSGTLTFTTPRTADQIILLATSVYISTLTATVNFTDGTNQAFTGLTVERWMVGTGTVASQGLGRVLRTTDALENPAGAPRLFQVPLTLSSANVTKSIQSITFSKTSTATNEVLHIFGATVKTSAANDVALTAVSGLSTGCALTNQEVIKITVTNQGTASQSNIPVSYQINGGALVNEVIAGPVAPGATVTYTFNTKANLSTAGTYTIIGKAALATDTNTSNDATTITAVNSLLPALPITLDFETATTGLSVFKKTVNSTASVLEGTAASNGTGTKGLIMAGLSNLNWVTPGGTTNPWTVNTSNFSSVKMCINPAGGNATDPLWLSFDLKQLFNTSNANTNFRVTVNGTPVGGNQGTTPANTYRPPFTGTPIAWQRINIDLTAYKTQPNIEIAFESSVKDGQPNGTANLIDNIKISRSSPTGIKENVLESQVNVFPNPSNGIFNISAPVSNYSLEVTDLTGKVIKQLTVDGKDAQLDMNNAAKGIYILKVMSEGKTAARKIVVE